MWGGKEDKAKKIDNEQYPERQGNMRQRVLR